MEKINIAELLKDYPKGMELDCTMYEDVYFDYVDELNIIHCYVQHKNYKTSITFNQHGTPNSDIKSKCVIFPKGETTWEEFQKPFKDGDIISSCYFDAICIFKNEGIIKGTVDYYCGISGGDELIIKDIKNRLEHFGYINEYNLATEREKEILLQTIKNNGYVWNPETKTLEKLVEPNFKVGDRIKRKGVDDIVVNEIATVEQTIYTFRSGDFQFIEYVDKNYELIPNKFDISTLKPLKSEVLVRDTADGMWRPSFWGKYLEDSNYSYLTTNGCYKQCIPYEDNEHLLGTTDDCDEYFKIW